MSTGYQELDLVVLARDLPDHGLRAGDLGTIVHAHSADTFEVEFLTASGKTQALLTLTVSELRPVRDDDLIAVRKARRRGVA